MKIKTSKLLNWSKDYKNIYTSQQVLTFGTYRIEIVEQNDGLFYICSLSYNDFSVKKTIEEAMERCEEHLREELIKIIDSGYFDLSFNSYTDEQLENACYYFDNNYDSLHREDKEIVKNVLKDSFIAWQKIFKE